jgi:hypothetical protein
MLQIKEIALKLTHYCTILPHEPNMGPLQAGACTNEEDLNRGNYNLCIKNKIGYTVHSQVIPFYFFKASQFNIFIHHGI